MSLRQVDFLHEPGMPIAGWCLLALGAVALASALWLEQRWTAEQAEVERIARVAVDERRARQRLAVQVAPVTPEDRRQRKAQAELSRPWLGAMRAIETATVAPVYLLSLKFDPRAGQVQLEAEAPSFEEALAYTRRLEQGRPLSAATLASHEQITGVGGSGLVKFSVLAAWSAE